MLWAITHPNQFFVHASSTSCLTELTSQVQESGAIFLEVNVSRVMITRLDLKLLALSAVRLS